MMMYYFITIISNDFAKVEVSVLYRPLLICPIVAQSGCRPFIFIIFFNPGQPFNNGNYPISYLLFGSFCWVKPAPHLGHSIVIHLLALRVK